MLTQELVRELLHYDPETGLFTWWKRERKWFQTDRDWKIWNTRCAGKPTGKGTSRGYFRVAIFYRSYPAHRLAWFYQTGIWPPDEIDHIDKDRANNRWANLRQATHAENARNAKVRTTNTSGYKGVSRNYDKWRAEITVNGKTMHLGVFITPEDAALAYQRAAFRYHREFAS